MNRFTVLFLLVLISCSGKKGGGSSPAPQLPVTPEITIPEIKFPVDVPEEHQNEPVRTKKPFKLKKTFNGQVLTLQYPDVANTASIRFSGEDAKRLYTAMDIRVGLNDEKQRIKQGHDVGCRMITDTEASCELSFDYTNGLIIVDKIPGSGVWKPFKNTDSWTGDVLIINDRKETAIVVLKNKDAEALYETLDIVGKPKNGESSTHEKIGTHIRCEKKDADLTLDNHEYFCFMTIKYEKGIVPSL